MDFDVLIIGGGAAGMSCALILGSAKGKDCVSGKRIGIVMHQKSSHLQSALFNNVLGLAPGTPGFKILKEGPQHLADHYPGILQIQKEKVKEVSVLEEGFKVVTNKNSYLVKTVVMATGYTSPFNIAGLDNYLIPHKKAQAVKERIQLINEDHLVTEGLYVAGSLAGWRSQFSIACGSGASVATDILTKWNDGVHTKVHDKLT